ncbi:MAG: RAD52 family DNA repair protein [Deinococcus sp.]|nr:RAD52 family DNA repair protein [Deinococcus sp.]
MNQETWELLAAPFEPDELRWRARQGGGAQEPYLEAKRVIERLDAVVGLEGWQDQYQVLPQVNGKTAVKCRLTLKVEGPSGPVEVSKEDLGEGATLSAAFQESLVRAARKFGVGRYLEDQEYMGFSEAPETAPWRQPDVAQEPETMDVESEKPEAQHLIDRLIDRLKTAGLGKEAAKVVMKYQGYGAGPEETKKLYGELRAMLKGQP